MPKSMQQKMKHKPKENNTHTHRHTQPNKHIQTQADRMSESQRFIHADDLSVSASPILNSPQSPVFQADSLSLQPAATYVPVSVWPCVCECAPLPTASFCFRFRKLSQLARHSQKETATKQGRIFWQFFCHTHTHTRLSLQECGHAVVALPVAVCVSVCALPLLLLCLLPSPSSSSFCKQIFLFWRGTGRMLVMAILCYFLWLVACGMRH